MIVWGKKTVYTNVGYVADFCPMCAGARPFLLQRIGSASHVYYVSSGEGELIGYQRNCATCHIQLRADQARYAAIVKKPESLSNLLKNTFPNFQQVYQAQLETEKRIQTDLASVPAQDRRNLIMTPFTLLSPKVAKRFATTSFGNQGYLKKEIIPALAKTLQRLHPTEEEIRAAMTRMVQLKEIIGSKLKVADLMAELRKHGSSGSDTFAKSIQKDSAQADTQDNLYVSPQTSFSSGELLAYHKAGRVLRLMAWLSVIGIVLIGTAVLIPQASAGTMPKSEMFGTFIFLIAITAGLFATAKGIMLHQTWGRVAGILYGLFSLIGFPVGTLIGLYVLWQLIRGWDDGESFA